jgi:starch phosphorylase
VQIHLSELPPAHVQVELYAEAVNGGEPIRQAMECVHPLAEAASGYLYSARVPAERPESDYTPRLIPHHPDVAAPLETDLILWQR